MSGDKLDPKVDHTHTTQRSSHVDATEGQKIEGSHRSEPVDPVRKAEEKPDDPDKAAKDGLA